MSSALFGPDGTQLPEPEPVLPDALVSPPAVAGDRDFFPPLTLPALTLSLDAGSVADELLPTPPRGFPLPVPPLPAPPHPVRRPPAVARGRSRQSGQPPHRQPPPPPRPQPGQPWSHRPAPGALPGAYRPAPSASPGAYRPAPGLPARPPATPPVVLPSPLLPDRRSNGWLGCVVVLVFSIGAFFPVLRALIDTVLGLVR